MEQEVWTPKTRLGRQVKSGEITSFEEILKKELRVMEAGIVDFFFPDLKSDLIEIGQAKGKFGGGQRRPFKRTQKKVREGARNKYTYFAIVGNENGYIGIGKGSSRESMPARLRALANAKRNIFKINRGCGDWECGCKGPHSLPFISEGKSASVRVLLKPAPRGTGLVLNNEGKKILRLAGISDAWIETFGQTKTRINYAYAIINALKKTRLVKIQEAYMKHGGVQ
ncbi:MAG: 30S ribosomal protein S5 [Candidatus Altiarchaeota archaeon]|nr:30S ribosomal protein S5 [Candidatus Altiarchaeota archaeon]